METILKLSNWFEDIIILLETGYMPAGSKKTPLYFITVLGGGRIPFVAIKRNKEQAYVS